MVISELFDSIDVGDVTALLTAIESDPAQVNAVYDSGLSLFETLLNAGYSKTAAHIILLPEFDINHKGHNPLRISVAMGYLDVARSLLEKGASPNYRPEGTTSALLLCLENEYFDLAELMIANGAEIDIRNVKGWTPLIWASIKGRRKCVDFLIAHGANIHACNNDGWNAVTGAYFKNRTDIVELLLEKGAIFGAKYAEAALLSAYENGYIDLAKHLLTAFDITPNITDAANVSLLAKAVAKGDWSFVRTLIAKKADVNVRSADGVPMLALLAGNGHKELIALMLDNGADIHLMSNDGETAIYCAAKNNQLETLRFLIEKGADINVQEEDGYTPLIIAAREGYLFMVELLVELGANIELKTNIGFNAKKLANADFKKIVKLLALPTQLIND